MLEQQVTSEELAAKRARVYHSHATAPEICDGPRVITVTSGNGGSGKSSVVINLAHTLAQLGKRVLVVDADLGTGDVCMLLGKTPSHTLYHVLSGERRITDIVINCGDISILPAGMGVQDYTALPPHDRMRLLRSMGDLGRGYDFFLIDPGAGIAANVTSFAVSSQEILLVLTPELSSLTDAYALVKTLSVRYGSLSFRLLVNRCKDQAEGEALYRRLTAITGRFLEVSIEYVGCLTRDDSFPEALQRRQALCRLFPETDAAHTFRSLARRIIAEGGTAVAPHAAGAAS